MSVEEETPLLEPKAERSLHDVWFGFGIAIASVIFILWVIPNAVVSPASVRAMPLDPRFLPYVLAALIGVLGVICGLQALLGPGVPKEAGEGFLFRRNWPTRLAAVALAFAGYYLLPERLGMLPVAVAVTGLLVWLHGERSVWRGIAVAVLLPAAVYLFFIAVAQVPLPVGVLGELG